MPFSSALYKQLPFLRPLLALAAGILLQYYCTFNHSLLLGILVSGLSFVLAFSLLPAVLKFRLSVINGLLLHITIATLGALLLWNKDVRNQNDYIGKRAGYTAVVGIIDEPPVRHANSVSSIIRIKAVIREGNYVSSSGRLLAYFKRDTAAITYGKEIIFTRPLQKISNSGNPGSFDYKTYCLFHDITYQVFLSDKDYIIRHSLALNRLNTLIYKVRDYLIHILSEYIPGGKEQGLVEALLLGYKEDLNKDLLRTYTNTGVVHIIAISGGHLAIIYGWLLFLTAPLGKLKQTLWLQTLLILAGLWGFTLLTGSQSSIVRSAIMFTCMACSRLLERRNRILNAVLCAAFLSLVYNPFWFWDAGFQLSYAAVFSMLLLFKPLYNCVRFNNKAIDFVWKLMALTLAAQIFTAPLSLYYFHQFPVLFLFANLVAVPLSGVIITAEILLCFFSFFHPLAVLTGQCIRLVLIVMNFYVARLQHVSFSVCSGLSLSIPQVLLFLLSVAALSRWWVAKRKPAVWLFLLSVLGFSVLRTFSFLKATQQEKLIVYNLPHYTAIEIIQGRHFNFLGDLSALKDPSALSFTILPAHTILRIQNHQILSPQTTCFTINHKCFFLLNQPLRFKPLRKPLPLDLLILSHNPKCSFTHLSKTFLPRQIVADATVPPYKVRQWQRECDSLHIPFFNTRTQGAFVLNLGDEKKVSL